MIKQFSITNMFGIQEMTLDFEVKGIQERFYKGIEEQVTKVDGKYYAVTPTFIAKNAAGKTSIIKSLEFASRFFNKDNFIKEMVHYAHSISADLAMMLFRAKMDNGNTREIEAQDELESFKATAIQSNIAKIFKDLSRDNENDFEVEVRLDGDDVYSIVGQMKDINIFHNNEAVSIFSVLHELVDSNSFRRSKLFANKAAEKLKKILSKTHFVFNDNFNTRVEYLENKHPAEIRKEVSKALSDLFDKTGLEFTSNLLIKMDDKIHSLYKDEDSGLIGIRRKDGLDILTHNLSFGTIKMIKLLDKATDVIENGGVLFVDEIENGLHISLIKLLVDIFANPLINKKKAQLILTTHNPLLIERNIVNHKNVLFYQDGNFSFLKQIKQKEKQPKVELDAYMRAKNYYNDYFWSDKDLKPVSTLSRRTVNQIINMYIARESGA